MGASQLAPPHIVEPDCQAGSRVWTDLLLQRSNQSKYLHGRYAWIRGASSRPHPSRFLHLEHTSSGGPSAPRATCIPMIPASCGEGLLTESHYRQAGSGAVGSGTVDPNVAGPNATGSSDGASHSHPPGVGQQPHTNRRFSHRARLRAGSHLRLLCRQTCCHWRAGCHYPREASYSRLGRQEQACQSCQGSV